MLFNFKKHPRLKEGCHSATAAVTYASALRTNI